MLKKKKLQKLNFLCGAGKFLNDKGQAIGGIIILLFVLIGFFFFLFNLHLPFELPFLMLFSLIIFAVAFINTDFALVIIILSMMLSPEIGGGGSFGERSIMVRVEDVVLLVVFCGWMAKMAINKEIGLLKATTLNKPIIAFSLISLIATLISTFQGLIEFKHAFFYILKYVEYFLLYFMVTNNIRSKKQIRFFLMVLLVTCAITCVYAILTMGVTGRASAPFEGKQGEPNTLGGYLVFMFAIVFSLFVYSPFKAWRMFCGFLILPIVVTLMKTLSRGSYLGFIFVCFLGLILFKKMKMPLLIFTLIILMIGPILLPKNVVNRVTSTFSSGRQYQAFGNKLTLDESASARIDVWKRILEKLKTRPLLGYGVTGVGIIDSQYALVLGETGILGLFLFLWLLFRVFKISLASIKYSFDDWERGLTLGFLIGFFGLLVHGFSAATFIIIRIMEPFWFVAGLIAVLPEMEKIENDNSSA